MLASQRSELQKIRALLNANRQSVAAASHCGACCVMHAGSRLRSPLWMEIRAGQHDELNSARLYLQARVSKRLLCTVRIALIAELRELDLRNWRMRAVHFNGLQPST